MRKQKKRNKKMLISCLLTGSILLSSLPGQVVSAGEITVTRSKTYTANRKDQTYDFPKSITTNGKKYLLKVTKYDVISEKPIKKEKKVRLSRKSNVKAKGEKADFPKQIKKDGITYVLQNVDQKDVEYKKAYTQSVTGYTDYDHQVSSSQVPATKTITVKNAVTGKMEKVQCKLSGITKTSKSGWQSTHINITFKNYDADVYQWRGKQITKSTSDPLKGYESELLKSVGASKADHRVLRSYWVGKPYTKNGMTYRNARADVQRRVAYYRANYRGSIKQKKEMGVVYTANYSGKKVIESDSEYTYRIRAVATYHPEPVDYTPVYVGVGIFLLLALIVIILFILRKKKGKTEEKETIENGQVGE